MNRSSRWIMEPTSFTRKLSLPSPQPRRTETMHCWHLRPHHEPPRGWNQTTDLLKPCGHGSVLEVFWDTECVTGQPIPIRLRMAWPRSIWVTEPKVCRTGSFTKFP